MKPSDLRLRTANVHSDAGTSKQLPDGSDIMSAAERCCGLGLRLVAAMIPDTCLFWAAETLFASQSLTRIYASPPIKRASTLQYSCSLTCYTLSDGSCQAKILTSGFRLDCVFLVFCESDWSRTWIWPANDHAKHCQCCLDGGEAAVSVRDQWGNSVAVTLPRRLTASRHPRHGENDAGNPSNTTKYATAPNGLFASRGMLQVFSVP